MKSCQNYNLTKLHNDAKIFGDRFLQKEKLDHIAEDMFVGQIFKRKEINLPNTIRSTDMIVFSADGKFVASCHGDNKIYISDSHTAKLVKTLEGHIRTLWTLTFHPVHNYILASGCSAGSVRVWDLRNGACQVWSNNSCLTYQIVASLSFHPTQDLLCIAINDEINFWDWRKGEKNRFIQIKTGDPKRKVSYIQFDSTGTKLITGISNDVCANDSYSRISELFLLFSREFSNNYSSGNSNSFNNSANNNNSSIFNDQVSADSLDDRNEINESLNNGRDLNFSEQFLNNQMNTNGFNRSFSFSSRLRDEYLNDQNEVLRSEALYNLSNAIYDSVNTNDLLPDNLPSFSFLQRNYQSSTTQNQLFNRLMRIYRTLGNIEETRDQNVSTSINEENNELDELNIMMETSNLVERFIHRYRNNYQNNNDAFSNYGSNNSLNNFSFLSRRSRFSHCRRRRLNLNRVSQLNNRVERQHNNSFQQRNDSDSLSSSNSNTSQESDLYSSNQVLRINQESQRINNSIEETVSRINALRESSLFNRPSPFIRYSNDYVTRNLSSIIRDSRSSSQNLNNSSSQNSSVFNTSNTSTSELSQTELQNSTFDSQNLHDTSANSSVSSNSDTTDHHDRFFDLLNLSHQQNRPNFSNLLENFGLESETNTNSNYMFTLISRIQNSINAINNNQANPLLESEDIRQLIVRANDVIERLINVTSYRDRLTNLRNIIRLVFFERTNSINTMSSVRFDLQQCLALVSMSINLTDQMQRILVTDLRFTQLSQLYLMRSISANNQQNNSRLQPNIFRNVKNNQKFDHNKEVSKNFGKDENNEEPIPSTSSGLRSSYSSKRKNSDVDNKNKKENSLKNNLAKKFKIPEVKVNNFDESSSEEKIENQNKPSENENSNKNDDNYFNELLRNQINNLLTNLETLTQRTSLRSLNSRTSFSNQMSSSLNSSGYPIHRVNNPSFSQNNLINNSAANSFYSPNSFFSNHTSTNNNNQWATWYENLSHRIQCWDFCGDLPKINDSKKNIVVLKCRISNNTSVDVSKNGEIIACLVPTENSNKFNVSIYSLKKSNLGQCLFNYSSNSLNAISVSLSPTSKYIVVGYVKFLTDSRIDLAQIFMLDNSMLDKLKTSDKNNNTMYSKKSSKSPLTLIPIKTIQASRNEDYMTLNSIHWLPFCDGLIYGTNNGKLVIFQPSGNLESWYFELMSNVSFTKATFGICSKT